MKKILLFIILTISQVLSAQNKVDEILIQISKKLEIDKADHFNPLITLHNFGNETLIVIPTYNEKEDGYAILNSNLVLINNKTKQILAKFHKNKDWYTDAIRLEKIEIDSTKFDIGKNNKLFKIKFHYSGSSKSNPYYSTNLSLFKQEKDSLIRLLKDYPIKTFNGETDTTCQGEFEEHSKHLVVLNSNEKYPKIKVIDSIKNFKNNDKCEEEMVRKKIIIDTLRFQDGEYKNAM